MSSKKLTKKRRESAKRVKVQDGETSPHGEKEKGSDKENNESIHNESDGLYILKSILSVLYKICVKFIAYLYFLKI